jgi:hypothetical protein
MQARAPSAGGVGPRGRATASNGEGVAFKELAFARHPHREILYKNSPLEEIETENATPGEYTR